MLENRLVSKRFLEDTRFPGRYFMGHVRPVRSGQFREQRSFEMKYSSIQPNDENVDDGKRDTSIEKFKTFRKRGMNEDANYLASKKIETMYDDSIISVTGISLPARTHSKAS